PPPLSEPTKSGTSGLQKVMLVSGGAAAGFFAATVVMEYNVPNPMQVPTSTAQMAMTKSSVDVVAAKDKK
ncbi:hypothetical protein TeGR_g8669, partial [Tetraparma gracilis]